MTKMKRTRDNNQPTREALNVDSNMEKEYISGAKTYQNTLAISKTDSWMAREGLNWGIPNTLVSGKRECRFIWTLFLVSL
jgi:hypothetical protein